MSEPSEWGEFPELSDEENQLIWEARALGFASFWPALPDARTQAANTYAGAKRFLQQREEQLRRMGIGQSSQS